jgi:hypothetical protein
LEREAFFTAAFEPKRETDDERPVVAGLKAEVEAADRRRARAETRIFESNLGSLLLLLAGQGRAGKEQ